MSIVPAEDRHVLRISLPAPLSVMGTVTQLIGAAWPDSAMRIGHRSVEFLIPKADPLEVPSDQVAEVAASSRDDLGLDTQITGMGANDGGAASTDVSIPHDEAWAGLGQFAAAALRIADEDNADPERFPNGVNYVEAQMLHGDEAFTVIACREGRDPTAMHRKVQAELDRYVERYGPLGDEG
ncbi:hypothetical protein LG293_17365 (plasmid) [Citricoccus nitrophenolicus]